MIVVANVAFYPNLRYDPVKDFEPIGLVAESPMAFVARRDFPAKDFKGFVAHLKANKEKVTNGFAGIGSASHLCSLLFFHAIDTAVNGVPYKGTAPALNDLMGGHLDFMCDQTLNVLQPSMSGLIKAYAATTPQRLKVAPDLPTIAESGLPDFQMVVWYAMYAPKGTPTGVVEKLSAALQKSLDDPVGWRGPEPRRSRLSVRAPTCCALTSNPKSISGCRSSGKRACRPNKLAGARRFSRRAPLRVSDGL